MNDPGDSLRARFRDVARERVLELCQVLERGGSDFGSPEYAQWLARVLHTLKGDAALMGMSALARAFHAVEDVLDAHAGADGRLDDRAAAALHASLELALREVGREPDDGHPATPSGAVPSAEPTAPVESAAAPEVARWIRQDRRALDHVSDSTLELWVAYEQLWAKVTSFAGTTPSAGADALRDDADAIRRRVEELVDATWALRLGSVEDVLRSLGQHATVLAEAQGKRLRARVQAGSTALERATLDALHELLLQLIRNAADHGIEPPELRGDKPPAATLTLAAETAGTMVLVTVEDDGRGIDRESVRRVGIERGLVAAEAPFADADVTELLFRPGFTTRASASQLSGRGTGLDIVRRGVEALGGTVTMTWEPGRFTRFTLALPAAVARERFVVVDCGSAAFALPAQAVETVVELTAGHRRQSGDGEAYEHRGEWLPLRSIEAVLGVGPAAERGRVLIVEHGGRRHAFATAGALHERNLLRRPADALVGKSGLVSASALLEDGRSLLILSLPNLVRAAPIGHVAAAPPKRKLRALVVDDSLLVRDLVCSILGSATLEASPAADGASALGALDAVPADLVVSDVEMPGMDGFELLEHIRRRWPLVPVVMLTARGSADDRRRAAALGADAYLVKSDFEASRLIDVVRRLLGLQA